MKYSLDDRIRQALSRGPLDTYELAYAVFPVSTIGIVFLERKERVF
jgi:hypothetical protein